VGEEASSFAKGRSPLGLVLLAWAVVIVPLLWGIFETLKKAAPLFR
jgi:hypothetical protein